MIFWKSVFTVTFAMFFIGCSSNSSEKPYSSVKGKVTLDASPLAAGKITFEGTAGVPAVVLDIKNGVYEGSVPQGTKTVRITSFKLVPPPKTGMTGEMYDKPVEQNILPARFNTASKDTKEIKAGSNEYDFAVESK